MMTKATIFEIGDGVYVLSNGCRHVRRFTSMSKDNFDDDWYFFGVIDNIEKHERGNGSFQRRPYCACTVCIECYKGGRCHDASDNL